jgi:hypothetical protein
MEGKMEENWDMYWSGLHREAYGPDDEEEEEPVKVEREDAESLREFLRDNLRVRLDKNRDWDADTTITVSLFIEGDEKPFTKSEIYLRMSL